VLEDIGLEVIEELGYIGMGSQELTALRPPGVISS